MNLLEFGILIEYSWLMNAANKQTKIIDRVSTRLKLKQLRLLVAIAAHKSILHAAKELGISQPAATKLLKDLELDFDVMLFQRTNRGVIPTEFGTALVRHGKLVLAQISHAAQELDDLNQGLGGRIAIGTLLTASAELLPRAIEKIVCQRPNVNIAIKEGTNDLLMPMLHNGELDLVVGRLTEYRYRKDLKQETLFDEQIVVAARNGHPLCELSRVKFGDLTGHHWILPPPETTLRRQIEKEFFDHGHPPPQNAVECVSFLTNRTLLEQTDMLCILPYSVIRQEVERGALGVISCKLNISSGPVGVSYRDERALSPAAAMFLGELRKTANELTGMSELVETEL